MSKDIDLLELERFLHQQIPITQAMGVCVASYDHEQLVLTAPLTLNHNHLGTAFGGSLGAIAMLAGYSLMWIELRDTATHVVIRDSRMSFRRPVRQRIHAACRRPDEASMQRFKQHLALHGSARLSLRVSIGENHLQAAVDFEGTYVALKSKDGVPDVQ